MNEYQTLIRHFETANAISVYNTLYGGAVVLAVQFGVVSSKPRTADSQRNHSNPQVANTKDYQFLDHLLNKFGENAIRIIDTDQFKQSKTGG